jgi:hypothetical protein
MTMLLATVLAASVLVPSQAAPAPGTPPVLAPAADIGALTLVRTTEGKAVVRTGGTPSELLVLEVGSRIGRTAARVRDVTAGRLVLDELTHDNDGRPHRSELVFRDGETGGTRYMRDPGADAPRAVRPDARGRDGKPLTIQKPKGL